MPTKSPSTPRGEPKLQRWVDLIASLLNRKYAVTFEQLAEDVPQYANELRRLEREPDERKRKTGKASLKTKFERDKQELRDLGVPIETEGDDDGNDGGAYRIDRRSFYLPYLSVIAPDGRATQPKPTRGAAYQALSRLQLTPGELTAIVDAASAVRSLGDPVLAADIDRALRKLAVDLPLDAFGGSEEPSTILPRARASNRVYELASEALERRRVLHFDYHALSTDARERRSVEPYGLFFLHGHWYLVARDTARNELRNFRLNRISDPALETSNPRSAHYEIPSAFRLREHATSRHAWELGDSDTLSVTVRVQDDAGATVAAARLGATIADTPELRTFRVRRSDTFVRWLLSLAGGLVPVAPAEVVEQYRSQIEAIRAMYARDPVSIPPASPTGAVDVPPTEPWQPTKAAAQLQRILQLMPELADGEEHSLAEIASRIGSDTDTLRRDLYSVAERYDAPGGFIEGVSILIEADTVSARSEQLRRPMRLTVSELCALSLGLAVLRGRRSPAEHGEIERAREKLESAVTLLPDDDLPTPRRAVTSAAESSIGGTVSLLSVMRRGVQEHRRVRLVYRKAGATQGEMREVCPYGFIEANGKLYLGAHCGTDAGVQFFRFDRMEEAELTAATFDAPAGFDIADLMRSGRVFRNEGADRMIVRYGKRIARWIAERESVTPDANGEVVLEHPLADPEWGIRHVLQYGVDAEILAPPEMREMMRARLEGMLLERSH